MKVFILFLICQLILSACPNMCAGHGTCSRSGNCICYPEWTEGDCSARVCPFDVSFTDPNAVVDSNGRSYLECSGQGECDRVNGLCKCFDGFEGASCSRKSCPNKCSGHGVCVPVEFLGVDEQARTSKTYEYESEWCTVKEDIGKKECVMANKNWDVENSFACVCDKEYEGYDCSMKKCPVGYTPSSDCDSPNQAVQTITFSIAEDKGTACMSYLEYTDNFGKVWYSQAFCATKIDTTNYCSGETLDYAPYIKEASKTILGWSEAINTFGVGVIDANVECSSEKITPDTPAKNTYTITITYGAQQTGRQPKINVITAGELDKYPYSQGQKSQSGYNGMRVDELSVSCGCKITPAVPPVLCTECAIIGSNKMIIGELKTIYNGTPQPLYSPLVPADKLEYEYTEASIPPLTCSKNGLCETTTGLCQCFTGFYGSACTEQSSMM